MKLNDQQHAARAHSAAPLIPLIKRRQVVLLCKSQLQLMFYRARSCFTLTKYVPGITSWIQLAAPLVRAAAASSPATIAKVNTTRMKTSISSEQPVPSRSTHAHLIQPNALLCIRHQRRVQHRAHVRVLHCEQRHHERGCRRFFLHGFGIVQL